MRKNTKIIASLCLVMLLLVSFSTTALAAQIGKFDSNLSVNGNKTFSVSSTIKSCQYKCTLASGSAQGIIVLRFTHSNGNYWTHTFTADGNSYSKSLENVNPANNMPAGTYTVTVEAKSSGVNVSQMSITFFN